MARVQFPLVSVLVLNYNGKRFLDDCFNSILDSTYPNSEVIMIDNLSTDDSVDYTEKNFPWVKVFQNGVNGGFSLAYNNAFHIAKGKYFVVLNNDVKVDKGWLEPLVAVAEGDPTIGALQPKLLSMLEPEKFEYAGASGGFIDRYGYPFARGRMYDHMETDHGQYDDIVRIFWATGAAMFLRANILENTGNLDVDFVHHMEEIDLCYRINLAGYQIKVVPQSVIFHYGGGVILYESYKKLYWNHRNSVFMLLKNLEGPNVIKIVPIRCFLDLLTIAYCLLHLNFKRPAAIVHAYFWLIFHPAMILKKRKDVRRVRRKSDKEMNRIIYRGSMILQFFLGGKKTFSQLIPAMQIDN